MTTTQTELPAMTGAEMQCTREFLGLPMSWLAAHLVMNERRMVRMEAGQERIPDALVSALDEIYEETTEEVQRLTASYRRKVKAAGEETVTLRTYRTDRDYDGKYTSRWHRMLCARVANAVPGLVLVHK